MYRKYALLHHIIATEKTFIFQELPCCRITFNFCDNLLYRWLYVSILSKSPRSPHWVCPFFALYCRRLRQFCKVMTSSLIAADIDFDILILRQSMWYAGSSWLLLTPTKKNHNRYLSRQVTFNRTILVCLFLWLADIGFECCGHRLWKMIFPELIAYVCETLQVIC